MKYLFSILLFVLALNSFGNMASPISRGDRGIKEVTSKNAEVTNEEIEITIDSLFQEVKFKVNYQIHLYKSGKNIPLLFIALGGHGYRNDFIIHCDGKLIPSQEIPYTWLSEFPNKFNDFNELWLFQNKAPSDKLIRDCDTIGEYRLEDMNYFEVDLDSGNHEIIIEYTGEPTIDRSGWTKIYDINYALSPIKYWKSHAAINIVVNYPKNINELDFNYNPINKYTNKAEFIIDSIGKCNFSIKYAPKINQSASNLIKFGQLNLTLLFGLFLFFIHYYLIKLNRKYLKHKYSAALIIGSLFIPLFTLIINMYSFVLIDDVIGIHASRFHGYTFFVLLLYPIILPVYWIVMWKIDKVIKRKMNF
jgi:hypothetical protein